MNDPQTTINFDSLKSHILDRLQNELSPGLTYHNSEHTVIVLDAAEKIGLEENIGDEEKLLLLTAALFHDTGFLRTYKNHEEASCEFAREILPGHGYTHLQIESICRIIMATKLPSKPNDILEKIICDADLHYLGTEKYISISDELYEEFKKQGLANSKKDWQEKQVLFLGSHKFFTDAGKRLFEEKKIKHLENLTISQHKDVHRYTFISDIFLMLSGVLLAGFGLKGFLVPNLFFDGGLTGISLLIYEVYHFPLAYVIVLINIPFIIAGYFSVSKKFAYKTFAAVLFLALCLFFIPYPIITSDKLLISIFGGVFLGLGIGFTMRAGCALDGIEVLALYTLKKTSFTITEIILGINIIIFCLAAVKFGIETSLYSVLTYFVASRMIDYVIEGIQAYTGVTIISSQSEVIKHRLVNEMGRGITVYKGERGFLPGKYDVSTDCDIIFTVVTRMELRKLKNVIYESDPKAFVFANTIREASGGIIKRRARH